MGIVYLAAAHGPARFSKLLVVKELKPDLAEDSVFLAMFLQEARLAARLNHHNIVQTYEIGAEGNRHFMVMDYLEGVTLARILEKKNDSFTLAMQLRILCETLQGLSYAHTLTDFDGTPLGIVHRDATPQNVFVTFDGQVKLVDFGIAKAVDSTVETRTGTLKGKPAYMAPEQINGDVDPRADVYAVGVMIWEAVVGHSMWAGKGDIEILTNLIKGVAPTLREAKPGAPEQLIRICDRALAKDRDERYPTAADLQADLEAYLVSSKTDLSSRDVGKLVAELFAAERASMRSTVELHITSLKSGTPIEKVPSIRPPVLELSTPTERNASSGSLRLIPASATRLSVPSPAVMQQGAAKRRRTLITVAAGIALAAVGVVLAARSASPKVPLVAEPSAAASSPSSAAAVVSHEVSVRVTPANATIAIEGVALSNPGKRACTHGQRITVHGSAAHYSSTDRELDCERDESIELVLLPEPVASVPERAALAPPLWGPAKRPTPVAPTPVTAPTPSQAPPVIAAESAAAATAGPVETNPRGGVRPTRTIDTASPY